MGPVKSIKIYCIRWVTVVTETECPQSMSNQNIQGGAFMVLLCSL